MRYTFSQPSLCLSLLWISFNVFMNGISFKMSKLPSRSEDVLRGRCAGALSMGTYKLTEKDANDIVHTDISDLINKSAGEFILAEPNENSSNGTSTSIALKNGNANLSSVSNSKEDLDFQSELRKYKAR